MSKCHVFLPHVYIRFFYFVLVSCQVLICQNNTFLHFQDEISLEVSFMSVNNCVLVVYVVVHGNS